MKMLLKKETVHFQVGIFKIYFQLSHFICVSADMGCGASTHWASTTDFFFCTDAK